MFVLDYNEGRNTTEHDTLEALVDYFFGQFEEDCQNAPYDSESGCCVCHNMSMVFIGSAANAEERINNEVLPGFEATYYSKHLRFNDDEWVVGVEWWDFYDSPLVYAGQTRTITEAKADMHQWCKNKGL